LLGEEFVAELKMKAIMAAIKVCEAILKRPGMGPDAPDLFFYAIEALDEDGDGNIGADEYQMLGKSKGEVSILTLTLTLTLTSNPINNHKPH